MGTGLTFDEYVDLKLKPPSGAGRAFFEAARRSTCCATSPGCWSDGTPPSECRRAIIKVAGTTGRIRGMKYKRADAHTVRPAVVVLDAPRPLWDRT